MLQSKDIRWLNRLKSKKKKKSKKREKKTTNSNKKHQSMCYLEDIHNRTKYTQGLKMRYPMQKEMKRKLG